MDELDLARALHRRENSAVNHRLTGGDMRGHQGQGQGYRLSVVLARGWAGIVFTADCLILIELLS